MILNEAELRSNAKEVAARIVDRMDRILSSPERWTKGTLARDKNGRRVSCESDDAEKWCILGARYKATRELDNVSSEVRNEASLYLYARTMLVSHEMGFTDPASMNDHYKIGFDEIRRFLKLLKEKIS